MLTDATAAGGAACTLNSFVTNDGYCLLWQQPLPLVAVLLKLPLQVS